MRLPYVVALWMVIAVALLSALAPLGTPLSRMTGSAFNPATVDVVIKARTPAAPQAVQATQPDGDDGHVALSVTIAVALSFLLLRLLTASPLMPVLSVPAPGAVRFFRRARAPPVRR